MSGQSFKQIALFPGQGSQHVGMSKEFLENFGYVREIFEEASDAVSLNLRKFCLDGPESDLTLTPITQPCLLTSSVAAFEVLSREKGYRPDLVLGHSLGEYSALVCAKAFPLTRAVRWVRTRGLAMQEAVPPGVGGMVAVMGLEDDKIEELCKEAQKLSDSSVEPANYNAPGQTVIAGTQEALDACMNLLKEGKFPGGKGIKLSVSAPFHSSLMKKARTQMAELFQSLSNSEHPQSLQCPYVPNRTARLTSEKSAILDLLVDQIDHAVLWKQSIENLVQNHLADPSAYWLEIGPGKVLQGLLKRIGKGLQKELRSHSVGDLASLGATDVK